MASAYSKPADYGTYTPSVNLDLVNFVLSSKQQKYDYNLAKLDDKISNQLGSLDLVRAEDKEYFLNRASNIINSMGDVSKMDLSQNGVTRQIDSKLSSIVDERVLNDVISTKNYRSFQHTLQTRQQEDPELYSNVNAAYAMETQGVNAWLNGQNSSLGTVEYQDYVDVSAELREISENLSDYAKVIKRFDMDGSYFITQEGERLQAHEVTAIAEQHLSDKAKAQMDINGWANYDRGTSDVSIIGDEFRRYTEEKLAGVGKTLASLEMRVKNEKGVSSEKLEEYQQDLEDYRRYDSNLRDSYSRMLQDPGKYRHSMTSTMEKDRVLTRFGETFAIDNVGDPVYSANSVATMEKKLAWEREKFMMEMQAKSDLVGDGTINPIEFQDTVEGRGGISSIRDNISKKEQAAFGTVNSIFNQLSVEDQRMIDAGYNKDSGETIEEYRYKQLKDLATKNSSIVSASDMMDADRAMKSWQSDADSFATARTEAIKFREEASLSTMLEEYKDVDNFRMKITDENGKVISSREFLKGIESVEDFDKPENHGKREQMLKAYYADKILSTDIKDSAWQKIKLFGGAVLGAGNGLVPGTTGLLGRAIASNLAAGEEDVLFTARLMELFNGDEKAMANYLTQAEEGGAFDDDFIIDRAVAMTGVAGQILPLDDSVTDDNAMNALITLDNVNGKTVEYLNEDYAASRRVGHVINTDTEVGKQLAVIASGKFANVFGEGAVLKTGPGRGITIVENTPDTVSISGLVTIKGQDVRKEITLFKQNLPPALARHINFDSQKPLYTRDNMQEVENNGVTFFEESNMTRISDVENVLLKANPAMGRAAARQMAWKTTTAEIMGDLSRNYPTVMGTSAEPTQQRIAIERMLKGKRFNFAIRKIGNEFREEISFNNAKGEKIGLRSDAIINENDYESATTLANYMPQLYIYNFLEQQLQLNMQDPNNIPESLQKIITNYGVQ